jgi:chain length determinant protein tyrosine kinase EpsG
MSPIAQDNIMPLDGASRVLPRRDRNIGSILMEEGKLEAGDIERVIALQESKGLRFGEAACRLGLITEDDLRGVIAKQYDLPHLLPGNESANSELVAAYAPFHARAEEMRALRMQLSVRWANAGVRRRVLAIASPGSGEGRSYVAANLAVVFSQLGERTLLIDADLRRPRQHRIFNVSDRIGLSAVLSGRADRSALVPVSEYGRLSLLPAGALPPNPQDLLSRLALPIFLQEIRADFDVVLIDTPPSKLYADAQSVASRAGSVIVLARKNRTRLADMSGVIRQLSDTGAQVIGTVFNVF